MSQQMRPLLVTQQLGQTVRVDVPTETETTNRRELHLNSLESNNDFE